MAWVSRPEATLPFASLLSSGGKEHLFQAAKRGRADLAKEKQHSGSQRYWGAC